MSINKALPKSRLFTRTMELLRTRPRELTLDFISNETGIKVTWLTYILTDRGDHASASCDRIEVLYEFLTKSKLDLK